MSLPALYEIAGQYRELLQLADDGDLPPELIRDTLERLTGDLEAKAINVAKFAGNLDAVADSIDEAAEAMRESSLRRADSAD